jgi:hypothetical protein
VGTSLVLSLIVSTLMMEAETVSEMLDCNSILIWLIAQEDFVANNIG